MAWGLIAFAHPLKYPFLCSFRCLVKDFEKRPFVDDLLEHSFVSGISLKSHIVSTVFMYLPTIPSQSGPNWVNITSNV